MNFTKFKEIVTLMYNCRKERNAYTDSLPREFSDLIVMNKYSESLHWETDSLYELLLGDLSEDVYYFLYETPSDTTAPNIFVGDREYTVIDLESYFEYAEKELFNAEG